MDDGKMMTGNAGTVAIAVNCAQSAHCLISWGHFSTKDWNARALLTKCSVFFSKRQISLTVFIPELPVQPNIYH